MTKMQKLSLFVLRLAVGWMMFYAGITKVLNPAWTSAGYLKGAKTFVGFYSWLTQPNILPTVDFLNKWGLTLLGVSLILGVFVKFSSRLGALLMLLYYFPILDGWKPNASSFLVDQHIIYAALLMFFVSLKAGRTWGLEKWCAKLPLCKRMPRLRNWLG